MTDELQLLTPDEVCELLKVNKDWLYDQYQCGALPGVKLGRKQLRFRRSAIERYLSSLEQGE